MVLLTWGANGEGLTPVPKTHKKFILDCIALSEFRARFDHHRNRCVAQIHQTPLARSLGPSGFSNKVMALIAISVDKLTDMANLYSHKPMIWH